MQDKQNLGIFDSGIGGLSVTREIQQLLPHENLIYLADQNHLPYGPRSLEEIRGFMEGVTRYFLTQRAKVIVIACNTASAASLHYLRERFRGDASFVGMEPAVRPAARDTERGTIGVIATAATFQGELYASLIDRFAQGIKVIRRACPELVTLAERGGPWTEIDHQQTALLLQEIRGAEVDQLVLGCTHFALLKPLLQNIMGAGVMIVDPAPAVARQVARILERRKKLAPPGQDGRVTYLTSGEPGRFSQQIQDVLGAHLPDVRQVSWNRAGDLL